MQFGVPACVYECGIFECMPVQTIYTLVQISHSFVTTQWEQTAYNNTKDTNTGFRVLVARVHGLRCLSSWGDRGETKHPISFLQQRKCFSVCYLWQANSTLPITSRLALSSLLLVSINPYTCFSCFFCTILPRVLSHFVTRLFLFSAFYLLISFIYT